MIQEAQQQLRRQIAEWLRERGVVEPVVQLERSTSVDFGEYSTNAAMRYAKELGEQPLTIAGALADFLTAQEHPVLQKAVAVKPGFVNLHFTTVAKGQQLATIRSLGNDFGKNDQRVGERWVVEHTSPNPNKAMHLGHLRNNLVGMSIVRLLQYSGAEVVADAVYNNRGIAIAKMMYGYLAHMKKTPGAQTDIAYWQQHKEEWYTPAEKGVTPDLFVTECYVLAEEDVAEHPAVEAQVRSMVVAWEAHDEAIWELWELVLAFAYEGNQRVLERLGNHWDRVWYEHEHYQRGKEYVEEGLKQGVFQQLPDGAVLTDLEETYHLPDTVLLKNDGTSLYITQDIALTDLKKKTYDADKLVWVIGPDQSLAMQQLFAVCEQLGIGARTDFTHVPYGYVGLRDTAGAYQKMSSRKGTAVLIDDVIDVVKEHIEARFVEEGKVDYVTRAELLALAAVKFSFLKSDRTQGITFDIAQSVDTQGDSGMYVMYAYVRTQSILRKAKAAALAQLDVPKTLGEEAALLRSLLYFDDVIVKATNELSVHHVAQYLLEVSSEFNKWYAKETILDGTEREAYRLAIVEATGITLKNGLALLGIETVTEI